MRRLTILLLIFSSLALAACGEPAEREAKYVARGKALYEKGDYEHAMLELKNALQINPEGVEPVYYQGLISEAQGDLSTALYRFQKVYELDNRHIRAILKIGNIYLITNALDEAEAMADKAAEIEPDNGDLGALKAGIALRRENMKEAQALAEAVLKKDPAHVAAAGILARILSDQGHVDQALDVLNTAIRLNPENQNLRRVKILLRLENGDLASAEKVYFELFALAPEFFDYRKELVRQYIAYGRLDDGEKLLRDLVAEFPQNIEPKRLLVDFLLNQRSFAVAEQQMLNFLAEDPENDDLRIDLAGIYVAQGLPDKAETVYREILRDGGSDKHLVLAQVGLARMLLDRGEVAKAAKLLDKVVEDDPENGAALLLQSRAYLTEDDYPRAILTLRNLLHQEPSSGAGLVLLVQAHLMAKQPGLAIEALKRLIEIEPANDRGKLLLASLLMRRGDPDEAYPLVEQVLARNPKNSVALADKFQILLARGAWVQAETVARDVEGLDGGAGLAHEFFGQLYRQQGLFSDAAAEFRAALDMDGGREAALTGLIETYLAQNRAADAEKVLRERLAEDAGDALAFKLLGDVRQASAGGTQAAVDAYRQAIVLRPSWPEPYLRLAFVYRGLGQREMMTAALERGLANAPDDEALTAALEEAAETGGDSSRSIDVYESMIARSEENVAVADNLVAFVSGYDYENEAPQSIADGVTESFKTTRQPALLDTLGWVHYRLGNYEEAIDYLNKALSNGGDTPQVRYHLGMVYLELGEADRARQELEMAVQSDVTFPGLGKARQALAEL